MSKITSNRLDKLFQGDSSLKIMTHVVAGFPSFEVNLKCIQAMEESGADLIEIQIPFSDPMADGPTIMKANQQVLNRGFSMEMVYDLLQKVVASVNIPVLVMTYYNIPFSLGLENFFAKLEEIGIVGVIAPDIPFDEEKENYIGRISHYNLHPILVISPNMEKDRLDNLFTHASGMVYTTLRIGITGSKEEIQEKSFQFLDQIRRDYSLPIAAGFGISTPEQVAQLVGRAEVAVIGSKIIQIFQEHPPEEALSQMSQFLQNAKKRILS